MAEFYDGIDDKLRAFIEDQPVFFVASAPHEGRVNISPKGMDTFRVLGPNEVVYLDMTGSGNETAAHLWQNGRITVMFCSFTRNARILRLFGHGRVVPADGAEGRDLAALFPAYTGLRQFIRISVAQAQTSCGYAVPEMKLVSERDTLQKYWQAKGPEGAAAYRDEHNRESIDGLPTGWGETPG
jgi:hypothetical protein